MALKKCCRLVLKKEKLKLAAEFSNVISEPNRLNILRLLRDGAMSVGDIWQYLDLTQSLVSHHLKIMKNFGLLNTKREGKSILYSLDKQKLNRYKKLLVTFI
jgi:ArsR family transcriptional regulator